MPVSRKHEPEITITCQRMFQIAILSHLRDNRVSMRKRMQHVHDSISHLHLARHKAIKIFYKLLLDNIFPVYGFCESIWINFVIY